MGWKITLVNVNSKCWLMPLRSKAANLIVAHLYSIKTDYTYFKFWFLYRSTLWRLWFILIGAWAVCILIKIQAIKIFYNLIQQIQAGTGYLSCIKIKWGNQTKMSAQYNVISMVMLADECSQQIGKTNGNGIDMKIKFFFLTHLIYWLLCEIVQWFWPYSLNLCSINCLQMETLYIYIYIYIYFRTTLQM